MGGKFRFFLAYRLSPIAYCLLAGKGPQEIANRERMREPVVCRREVLIILTKAAASESVKDPIDVCLPLINRSKLPDELRKRVWIFLHSGHGLEARGYGYRTKASGDRRGAMGEDKDIRCSCL